MWLRPIQTVQELSSDIRAFLAYSLLSNIGIGVFLTLFNLYLTRRGLFEDFIGLQSGVQTAALAITAALLGPVVNRHGTVVVTRLGLVAFTASSLALATVDSPAALLVAGLFNGAAWAALIVPNMPFVIERVSVARRPAVTSLAFALQMLSVTFGNLLGGLLPTLLRGQLGLGALEADRATLVAGVSLAALGLVPLLRISRRSPGGPVVPSLLGDAPTARRTARVDIAVFSLSGALMAAGASATQPFMNVYFAGLGASTLTVGLIFSGSSLLGAIATVFGPALVRRVGAFWALALLRFGVVPVFLPLLWLADLGLAATTFTARVVSFSVAWPIEASLIGQVIPERQRAMTFGLRSASWNGSWAIFSYLAGQVIVNHGYVPVFAFFMLTVLAAGVIFQVHFRRRLAAGEPAA